MSTEKPMSMKIAILGGGKCTPEHSIYERAMKLGGDLAREGHTIITGGYDGIMEAASRGAKEAGGQAIGVVLKEKPQGNEFLTETIVAEDFFDRLRHLLSADAFVFLPGGIGTVVELATVTNMNAKVWKKKKPVYRYGGTADLKDALQGALDNALGDIYGEREIHTHLIDSGCDCI